MLKLVKGFRDFILRGNVIDLAVGIVIGAAFTALVSGFTNSFLQPLIKAVGGGNSHVAGVWHLGGQDFLWAAFLNQLITFALTAAVLYFLVVLPMNTLTQRRRNGQAEAVKALSDEVQLLTEIRDALVAQSVAQGLPQPRSAPVAAITATSTPTQRQTPTKAQPSKAQPAKSRRR